MLVRVVWSLGLVLAANAGALAREEQTASKRASDIARHIASELRPTTEGTFIIAGAIYGCAQIFQAMSESHREPAHPDAEAFQRNAILFALIGEKLVANNKKINLQDVIVKSMQRSLMFEDHIEAHDTQDVEAMVKECEGLPEDLAKLRRIIKKDPAVH